MGVSQALLLIAVVAGAAFLAFEAREDTTVLAPEHFTAQSVRPESGRMYIEHSSHSMQKAPLPTDSSVSGSCPILTFSVQISTRRLLGQPALLEAHRVECGIVSTFRERAALRIFEVIDAKDQVDSGIQYTPGIFSLTETVQNLSSPNTLVPVHIEVLAKGKIENRD